MATVSPRRQAFLDSLPLPAYIDSDQTTCRNGKVHDVLYDPQFGPQYRVIVDHSIYGQEEFWMREREVRISRSA